MQEGQAALRRVLRAYAAYDQEVGYCQGMNFVAGLLLMYMPGEAHAFGALVMLMEGRLRTWTASQQGLRCMQSRPVVPVPRACVASVPGA